MGIRQDFLLRMMKQLADSYAGLFCGPEGEPKAEVEDKERALFEVEGVLAEVFRTRRELLFVRPEEMIEDFDPRLAAQVGRFFLRYSELAEAQGHAQPAERAYELAILCLRGGLGCELSHNDEGSNGLMRQELRSERITRVLDSEEMAEIWRKIFEIESRLQRYDHAEDAIFAAIALAKDPTDHVQRGMRFYRALLKLPDEVLEEADLPREEVEEALEELEGHLS
jgi:hypothetical protein